MAKNHSYITEYDYQGDGVLDAIDTDSYTYNSKGLLARHAHLYDNVNAGAMNLRVTSYTYDSYSNKLTSQQDQYDQGNNGSIEDVSTTDYQYASNGLLVLASTYSLDRNDDGAPDAKSNTHHDYNISGQETSIVTDYFYDNVYSGESIVEIIVYNTSGQLTQRWIDDPIHLDFTVGWLYDYNSSGKLSEIYHVDPFTYGNDEAVLEEQFTYDSKGRVATHTFLNEPFAGGESGKVVYTNEYWADSVKVYGGKLKAENIAAYDDNGNVYATEKIEHWYHGTRGWETTRLTTHDNNADGTAESYDLWKTIFFADGTINTQYNDIGADGVHEFHMQYTPEVLV